METSVSLSISITNSKGNISRKVNERIKDFSWEYHKVPYNLLLIGLVHFKHIHMSH